MRYQVVALKYKAYRMIAVGVPFAVREGRGRFSVYFKLTRGVSVKPTDDVQKRCFAAAGRSEDRHKLVVAE